MTNAIPTLSLHNGVQMPVLGFYQVPAEQTEQVVSDALAAGYRSIDTAAAYQNEEAVGRAIAASGSREPSSNRMHNDTSPSPRCHAIAPASTSSSSEKSAKVAVGVHAQQHPRQQHGRLQVRRAFAHPAAGAAARSGGRARPSPVPCG